MTSNLFKYLSSLVALAISFGYIGIIFLMILESCALPVSSEIVLGTAGFLSGQGKFNFYLVVLSATAGTLIGSSLLYLIGVKGGRIFLEKYGKYLLISKKDIEKADKWFAKYGSFAVFIGIMLPVIKTYIGFPPGASLMNYKKFAVFVIAGSLIYNTVVVYLGLKLGQNIYLIKPFFHKMGLAMIIIIFILFAIYIYAHVKKAFAK
jgi:membrane protein DedA with SNARE-associated domain